jgi:hypothetical protein
MTDGPTAPISQPLTLRPLAMVARPPATPTTTTRGSGHRAIGRIFRSNSAPQDQPWMWTITGAVVMPAGPSHGFAATLAEAKTAFAEHWRTWLAWTARKDAPPRSASPRK